MSLNDLLYARVRQGHRRLSRLPQALSGEKLTLESPLIREQFNRSDPFRSVRARHVAQSTIMNTIKQNCLTPGSGPVYLRQRLLENWKKMSRTILPPLESHL
ncbi:MAG TPA: hypothetical protein VFH28_04945 [Nitrososphaera sp.]|nr:hypothetical protein [Nitrososphaera sp.]